MGAAPMYVDKQKLLEWMYSFRFLEGFFLDYFCHHMLSEHPLGLRDIQWESE